ncbi:MAG: hypothetical protein ACT4QC_13020 [Planctomycetaceae bacterium]
MTQRTLFDGEPTFVGRSTKAVTFQGKLGLPIHRWYRLTPSFSPRLALDIAKAFSLTANDFVLDPFSGVGTVPLCMKYQGIPACSVELNPYLHFVSVVKTRNYNDLEEIEETFTRFVADCRRTTCELPADPTEYLRCNQSDIPAISRPDRWWSPGNLMQLVCIRQLMRRFEAPQHHADLLRMGVLGILIPVSNAKHNHVSLTFAEQPLPTTNVADVIEAKLREMLADLKRVAQRPRADVTVHRGNSRHLSKILPASPSVSAVITSPPYPNRFSYARETRPHLFFFDFVSDARSVGELETDAIGGTWGRATSVLADGVEPQNDVVASALAPYLHGAKRDGNGGLMRSYVVKYFNNIYDHVAEIARICRPRAKLAYVIGNSKFYDHPLPSDEILATLFGQFGFELERIDRMRRRQSKSGLYEAVVFMRGQ